MQEEQAPFLFVAYLYVLGLPDLPLDIKPIDVEHV